MRAPDTPIGGPNEIPDPLTLSRSCQLLSALRPQALTTARTCGAKASSSSLRSIASILYDEKTLPGEGARWRGDFACPRLESFEIAKGENGRASCRERVCRSV